jgi:hypothetical protein
MPAVVVRWLFPEDFSLARAATVERLWKPRKESVLLGRDGGRVAIGRTATGKLQTKIHFPQGDASQKRSCKASRHSSVGCVPSHPRDALLIPFSPPASSTSWLPARDGRDAVTPPEIINPNSSQFFQSSQVKASSTKSRLVKHFAETKTMRRSRRSPFVGCHRGLPARVRPFYEANH